MNIWLNLAVFHNYYTDHDYILAPSLKIADVSQLYMDNILW